MNDSGETNDDRSLNARGPEKVGAREVSHIVGDLEEPFGGCSSCMHYTFWDTLSVKVGYLLYQVVVLQ